jgi:hypothetical protein
MLMQQAIHFDDARTVGFQIRHNMSILAKVKRAF